MNFHGSITHLAVSELEWVQHVTDLAMKVSRQTDVIVKDQPQNKTEFQYVSMLPVLSWPSLDLASCESDSVTNWKPSYTSETIMLLGVSLKWETFPVLHDAPVDFAIGDRHQKKTQDSTKRMPTWEFFQACRSKDGTMWKQQKRSACGAPKKPAFISQTVTSLI